MFCYSFGVPCLCGHILKIIDFLVTCSLGRRCICVIHKTRLCWVFGPLSKTLTLFRNKICHFPYPIYDLIKL